MRIIVIGRQFPDSFARNISVTLSAMGHEVHNYVETGVLSRAIPGKTIAAGKLLREIDSLLTRGSMAYESRQFRPLVRMAAELQPELILNTWITIPPRVLKQVKQACHAKLALWYTDSVSNLWRQYNVTDQYDGMFYKEPFLADALANKLSLPAHYLPECANPIWHKPTRLTGDEQHVFGCDVATAGGMYPWRAALLSPLAKYDLRIWGDTFPAWLDSPLRSRFQRIFVAEAEKAKAFCGAKIVVNTMHPSEVYGVNCRLFEAAACGTLVVTEWRDSLPQVFSVGEEVAFFRTRTELLETVEYYLANDQARATVAARGACRALSDHTYELRLKTILTEVGL